MNISLEVANQILAEIKPEFNTRENCQMLTALDGTHVGILKTGLYFLSKPDWYPQNSILTRPNLAHFISNIADGQELIAAFEELKLKGNFCQINFDYIIKHPSFAKKLAIGINKLNQVSNQAQPYIEILLAYPQYADLLGLGISQLIAVNSHTEKNLEILTSNPQFAHILGTGINILKSAKILTAQYKQALVANASNAIELAEAITALHGANLHIPHFIEILITNPEHARDFSDALLELHKINILDRETQLALLANPAQSKGLKCALIALHRAKVLTSISRDLLISKITQLPKISPGLEVLSVSNCLNDDNMSLLFSHPEHALAIANAIVALKYSNILNDDNMKALIDQIEHIENIAIVLCILEKSSLLNATIFGKYIPYASYSEMIANELNRYTCYANISSASNIKAYRDYTKEYRLQIKRRLDELLMFAPSDMRERALEETINPTNPTTVALKKLFETNGLMNVPSNHDCYDLLDPVSKIFIQRPVILTNDPNRFWEWSSLVYLVSHDRYGTYLNPVTNTQYKTSDIQDAKELYHQKAAALISARTQEIIQEAKLEIDNILVSKLKTSLMSAYQARHLIQDFFELALEIEEQGTASHVEFPENLDSLITDKTKDLLSRINVTFSDIARDYQYKSYTIEDLIKHAMPKIIHETTKSIKDRPTQIKKTSAMRQEFNNELMRVRRIQNLGIRARYPLGAGSGTPPDPKRFRPGGPRAVPH